MQYSQDGQPIFQQREPSRHVNFAWISEAFGLFKQQSTTWAVSTVIAMVGLGVLYMFAAVAADIFAVGQIYRAGTARAQVEAMSAQMTVLMMVFSIPLFVLMSYFMSGFLRMAIRQIRGEHIEIADLFRGWSTTPRVFGLYLIQIFVTYAITGPLYWKYYSMTISGSLLATEWVLLGICYLTGILVTAVFGCFVGPAYVLVADGENVFRAIGRSVTTMSQDWLRAFGLWFVFGVIVAASAIPCGLGLLVTMPMLALKLALIYRDMLGLPRATPLEYNYAPQAEGVWPPPPSL